MHRSFPSAPPCTPGFAPHTRRTESFESHPPCNRTQRSTRPRALRCTSRHRRRTPWNKSGYLYVRRADLSRRSRPRWEAHPHHRLRRRRCRRHRHNSHRRGKRDHRRWMCPSVEHLCRTGPCPFAHRDLCRRRRRQLQIHTPKEKNETRAQGAMQKGEASRWGLSEDHQCQGHHKAQEKEHHRRVTNDLLRL